MLRTIIACALLLIGACHLVALRAQIEGLVKDENGDPLPYATLYILGTTNGASTNEDGRYRIKVDEPGSYEVRSQYIGYKTQTKTVAYAGAPKTLDFDMQLDSYEAPEVVIDASAEDPAYPIIRKAIDRRKFHLEKQGARSSDVYIKSRLDLNEMPEVFLEDGIGELSSIFDIDSTNGQGILYLSESKSRFHRKDKNTWKEVMYSSRVSASDNEFSFNTARSMDFSIYERLLPLGEDVVSPIAGNAMSHYRYELLGTSFNEQGQMSYVIRFEPKNGASVGANGILHVMDEKWSVPRASMGLSAREMDNGLMDSLHFDYQAIEVAEDVWMDMQKNFYTTIRLFGFEVGLDYHGVFTDYELNPDWEEKFFDREVIVVEEGSNKRDDAYWNEVRPIELTKAEEINYEKSDTLQENREKFVDSILNDGEKFSPSSIFRGYSTRLDDGRKRYTYGLGQTLNTVQGVAIEMNHRLSTNRDSTHLKQWSLGLNAGYSIQEERFRGSVSYERRPTDPFKMSWSAEVGRHIVQYRQSPPLSDLANIFYGLIYENNYARFYEVDVVAGSLRKRSKSGWQWYPYAVFERRRALVNNWDYSWAKAEDEFESNNPLAPRDDSPAFASNSRMLFGLGVGYRFDQRFIRRPDQTIILPSKYPKVNLGAQFSSNLDTDEYFIQAQLDIADDYDLGLWGGGSWSVSVGSFFMDEPTLFTDFKHFDGNQTAFIYGGDVSRSFLAMDYYDFSTNQEYAELHVKHSFQGQLLRRIPLIRALKWHTVTGVNVLYTNAVEPYTEAYVGIEHIGVKFFRPLAVYAAWSFDEDRHFQTDLVLGVNLGSGSQRSPRAIPTDL